MCNQGPHFCTADLGYAQEGFEHPGIMPRVLRAQPLIKGLYHTSTNHLSWATGLNTWYARGKTGEYSAGVKLETTDLRAVGGREPAAPALSTWRAQQSPMGTSSWTQKYSQTSLVKIQFLESWHLLEGKY